MVSAKSTKNAGERTNTLFKRARLQKNWSQQEVANLVGAPQIFMVSRWESGKTVPNSVYRERLRVLFGMSSAELGFPEDPPSLAPNVMDLQAPIYDPAIPVQLANRPELVGRDTLLAQIKQQICNEQGIRFLALNGLPGVGKTALTMALTSDEEVRNYFRGGMLWAGLGSQPTLLTHFSRWGILLSLSEKERSSIPNEQEWMQTLRRLLGRRRMLIIIDDAWCLEDALKCTVGGEQCTYILTTRNAEIATYFAGKHTIKVSELDQRESIQFLSQILPTSVLEAEMRAVCEIVQAVGGLPLALNLLGMYLLAETRYNQSRRIQAALQRLLQTESRFQIEHPQMAFQQSPTYFGPVSQSLQATIKMSISRLSKPAQRVLYALSIFPTKPNSFSEEAAIVVADIDAEMLDTLVDMGLLEVQKGDRYYLHQTIADYARLYLSEQGTAFEERMVRYWVCLAETQSFSIENIKLLEADLENILNALELASQYHFSDLLIRGVCLYYPILKNQGLFDHLKRWLLEVKHIVEGSNDFSRRLKILLYLTEIHEVHGEYCRAEETGQEGLQLFADHHSTDYETYQAFMVVLAHIEIFRGRYDHARKYLLQGLNLPEEERNVEQTCHLFRLMGVVMDFQSHTQQAQVYWYKALTLARILGKEDVLIRILGSLGAGLARQELYKEAKEHLIEGLDLAQKYQYLSEISNFHLDLGDIAVIHNEYDIAEFHLQKSLLLAQQLQLQPTLSVALATLGELELKRGHEQQAQAYFQEGLVLARQKGNNDYVGAILSVQAEILLQKNELEGAKETFFEALRCIPADNTLYIATARYGLARVLIALDQRADAIEQATISLLLFQERKSSKAQEVQAWLEEHNSLPPTNGDQKTSFSRI